MTETGPRIRNKEIRRVKVADILDHPQNARTHPSEQEASFTGTVKEIGWYGYPDVFEHPEHPDKVMLSDGHLRRDWLAKRYGESAEIEVNVTDFTPDEAKLAMVSKDALAALAESDAAKLEALLSEIQTEDDAVREMLDGLAEDAGILEDADEHAEESPYTNKIIAPVYEPKGERPPLSALIDRDKTQELIEGIDAADLPDDVKEFLRLAAERHTVFNFRQIAEYYCHADAVLQDLMERSGLVIIDFNKAIEYGFVHLTERLGELADLEEADDDA